MNRVERIGGMKRAAVRTLMATVTAMALGTALVAAPGCIIVADGNGGSWRQDTVTETRTMTVPHVAGSSLDVRTQNGAVEVQQGDGEQVVVTATITARTSDRLAKTTVSVDRGADGTLQVRVQWPEGVRKAGEGASFIVRTPSAKQAGAAVGAAKPAPESK